ncbi:uncharacterized protein LOC100888725 [Strongylocentrotus purpuratus]|uniref:EGF-like domain-containing protein n=1 Tax=Strongylocentrotus purpuratus TaxID=7668 RepID=A0A7M7SW93_STRPU|nr:uncharacterized protein LOC100888725 [Strongylocentrotus purpuratus]
MLYGIYRRRYGNLFYGIVINSWRLGSLEVDTDAMFIDPDNATSVQTPTPGEVAEVFTDGISNGNTTYGITVDDSRTVASDKDECSNSTLNDCSQNAECTNTDGSYDCTCLHGYTDTSTTGSEAGTQCEVVAYGLSDGAIVGLAVGSVIVVMLIVILSVCSLVAMRRIMYRRRLAVESPNKLGTMREARRPIDYGHYRDRDSMGDHRPDMEMGSKSGYDEGPYYSRAHDNDGFIRGYLATGKNGSAHGKHSWNHADRRADGLF